MRHMQVFTPTGAMRAWATVLMLIVGFGLALGLTIAYVNKVDRAADHRDVARTREICEIVVLIDDRQQKLVPTTEDQRTFFAAWHRYRVALGCP